MPKVFLFVVAVILGSLAGVAWWVSTHSLGNGGPQNPQTSPASITSAAIYAASFPDVGGVERTLGQWQHKLLIVNFWATWCAPCKEEMPLLAKMQVKYASSGLQIVGIAADSREKVANFLQNTSISYPLLPDEARAIEFSKRLGNRLGLLPFTVVIKPNGGVVYTRMGQVTASDLEAVILQNLPK